MEKTLTEYISLKKAWLNRRISKAGGGNDWTQEFSEGTMASYILSLVKHGISNKNTGPIITTL